ncbi:MAG: ABC transporter permease [Acidimicrobiia bacterium]
MISILAFAGKEIRQVLRQPKLMTALIVGPFVILGLFAAGFQPNPPALRTLVVTPAESALAADVQSLGDLGGEMEVVDVITDEEAARARLLDGEVDLVVVAPADAAATIRGGEKATVMVLHDRLDPFDRAAIVISAQAAVEHLNRSILSEVTAAAQDRMGELAETVPVAREAASTLAEALRTGEEAAVTAARSDADEALASIEQQIEASSGFLDSVAVAAGDDSRSMSERVSAARSSIDDLDTTSSAALEDVEAVEADLESLENAVTEFRALPPEVLVQPFVAETEAVAGTDVSITTYYSPAVVVVLLQHVVLTFAALSVVGERSLGTTELFRVGPVRTTELMVGKLIGYAVLGVLVGALLIAAIVFLFGTAMAGSWAWLAVVLILTMAASLGLGFVIAAAAGTDAQAVQYAMLALLFTIFFSGMIVSLARLAPGVRQVAFLAPATAGTSALHDVMFRGQAPRTYLLLILGGYALVTLLLARWWLGRQRIA